MSRTLQLGRQRRQRRRYHVRSRIKGTPGRPRLTVQKSLKHIYAQLIDDTTGSSIMMVSSVGFPFEQKGDSALSKIEKSVQIGTKLAEQAKEKGITQVVFDRNHNLYHGRVKAVADAARKAGLEF